MLIITVLSLIAFVLAIVLFAMTIAYAFDIDLTEWIDKFRSRNDYINDSNEPLYSFQMEKYRKRKKRGVKHCRLCGATVDLANDTTYCDRYHPNYLYPNAKTKLCINCQYTIYKNGIITVPYSKDIGDYFENKWGSYGRRDRTRAERERYVNLIIKMNMITDWNFINNYYISHSHRDKEFRYNDDTYEMLHEKDVEDLLNYKTYDKFADIFNAIASFNKVDDDDEPFLKFIKYDDMMNYLTQYFGNEPKCCKCETKIFTPRMSQIMRNKIEQDDKLDNITKYAQIYHLEQKIKDKIENVNYFIDKSTDKIKPYCGNCAKKSIGKDVESSSIKLLEPVVYYDSLDEIKKLL